MDQQNGSRQNRGELADQILARIAGDAEFRQRLLADPAETLRQEGYDTDNEVEGYGDKGLTISTSIGCGLPPDVAASDAQEPVGTTAMGCGGGGGVPGPDPYESDPANALINPKASATTH